MTTLSTRALTTPQNIVTAQTVGAVSLLRATLPRAGGGELAVAPSVYREWVSLSNATTASNQNVQEYIGWALEAFSLPDGAEIVLFERGAIVLRPDARCFATYGTIYFHWRDLFDLKTGTGVNIGYPITEEEAVSGGRRSRFDSADIYWNAARNAAFEVHGAIRDQWYALGGYSGFLGYPISDESSVMTQNGAEIGRYSHFEGGTIFWSGATGAFEVHGAIRDLYFDTYNGPAGALGFPISNETPSPSGNRRYNDFEHGCVVWHADSGALDVYTSLDVFIGNINGSGSHTWFEEHGFASVWLYARGNVCTTTGINYNFHLPPGGGDYGHPSASPGQVCTINPVRGDMTVILTLDGWDKCNSTSDQHLGTLHATFNVDNDFGVNQPRHLDDGDFHGDVDMRMQTIDNPNDPNFRRAEWWGFNNFRTPTLSKQQYAETFVDVESNESDWHWFDSLYYDKVYKSIAAGGNCYGMCLESAYAEHNDSLLSEPIYPIPAAQATNSINIKQGYQLGAAYLDWFAANFLTFKFWDPCKVYEEAKAAWDRRDYPFICITNATRSGGHCVRPCPSPSMPYPFVDTGSQYIISVANPNAPGTDGTDAASQLVIDKASNTYSIALSNGGQIWTGGYFCDGIISWVPFSVVCREPRTPFWEALVGLGIALIFLGDDGSTRQITDNNGNVLYKADRVGKSNRWDDLATDSSAIPGLVRMPLSGGFLTQGPLIASLGRVGDLLASETGPELYRLVGLSSPFGKPPLQSTFTPLGAAPMNGNVLLSKPAVAARSTIDQITALASVLVRSHTPPTTLTHQIAGRGRYTWGTHTGTSGATMIVNSSEVDEIGIERLGVPDQLVSLRAQSGATRSATIAVRSRMPSARNETIFELQNVTVSAGETFKANVLSDGTTLQVQNLGETVNMQVDVHAGNQTSGSRVLQIPAGKTATLTPSDVNALPSAAVRVNFMDAPGAAIVQTLTI